MAPGDGLVEVPRYREVGAAGAVLGQLVVVERVPVKLGLSIARGLRDRREQLLAELAVLVGELVQAERTGRTVETNLYRFQKLVGPHEETRPGAGEGVGPLE